MKQFVLTMIASLALGAGIAAAAGVDGKWSFESTVSKKSDAKVLTTLELKSEADKLTGTVTNAGAVGKKGGRAVEIQEGKIEGAKITFVTVQTSKKKGDVKVVWEATLDGDTLNGSRTPENAKRGQSFSAKRVN